MKKSFKFISKSFVIWWLGLIFVSIAAFKLLPFKPRFPFWDTILIPLTKHQFLWQWANFDGVHYLTIAEKGYIGTGLIQAFFPLYPLVIKYLNKIVGNFLYSGLLISYVSFFLSLLVFNKLLILEKVKDKKWSILFLLAFPTSFYFICLYTESLFLLLVLLAFLFMKKKQWLWAVFFASLSSGVRLVGIFVSLAIAWEYYSSFKLKKNIVVTLKSLLLGLIGVSGFILFCLYLAKNFGDPFFFAKVQSAFGASRETDKIILFHQVTWRYIKMILTVKKTDILFYTVMQEFVLSFMTLGFLIFGWLKKMNRSFLIYGFLSFILPTLTGNLSSMPRYVSVIFIIYIILGNIKNKKVKYLTFSIFIILLIINTALFLRGFWVA